MIGRRWREIADGRLQSRLYRVINDDRVRYDKSNFKHRVGPIVSGVHTHYIIYSDIISFCRWHWTLSPITTTSTTAVAVYKTQIYTYIYILYYMKNLIRKGLKWNFLYKTHKRNKEFLLKKAHLSISKM